MTTHNSFKQLVRSRMAKTGESYTAARAMLLAAKPADTTVAPSAAGGRPPLVTSDAEIRRRTGRGWEEWFDLLDEYGAPERSHREVARWVAEQLGIEPLVWEAQAVTHSYERARGLRAVGQHADGYTVTASRTVQAPATTAFDALTDEAMRARWLPDAELRLRTATRPRSARFDWGTGAGRVAVTFDAKGPARTTVSLQQARLADADRADHQKAYWREHLGTLKALLEAGEPGA